MIFTYRLSLRNSDRPQSESLSSESLEDSERQEDEAGEESAEKEAEQGAGWAVGTEKEKEWPVRDCSIYRDFD
jgi:hypothetical protein